eukprot:SAG11_NODE_1025_length_6147_cov_54.005622_2_plen_247_part_00
MRWSPGELLEGWCCGLELVSAFLKWCAVPPELNRLRANPGEKPMSAVWEGDARGLVAIERSGVGMPPTEPDRRLVADKLASSVERITSMFSDSAATWAACFCCCLTCCSACCWCRSATSRAWFSWVTRRASAATAAARLADSRIRVARSSAARSSAARACSASTSCCRRVAARSAAAISSASWSRSIWRTISTGLVVEGSVWALGGIPSSVPNSEDRGPLSNRGVAEGDGEASLFDELPRFMRFIC